jgi:uncharacterized repeat protein (TIGR01451 family)
MSPYLPTWEPTFVKRGVGLILPCLMALLLLSSLHYGLRGAPVSAATTLVGGSYYVDAVHGSDLNGDGSQNAPWQTVSYGLSQVSGPDTELHVAPGVYNSALGESFPIVMKPGVQLIGADRSATILQGNASAHVVHFPGTGFFTETTVIRGFKITHGNNGVLVSGRTGTPSSPVVEDNWIAGNAIGARVYAVSSQRAAPIIQHNLIEQNNSRGIDLYAGYSGSRLTGWIVGNEITHNSGHGIYCFVKGAGSSGSSSNSRCNPEIHDNEIAYNSGHGFHCDTDYAGECRINFNHNRFTANSGWGVGRQHVGTYLMTNRPVFVNNLFVGNGFGGALFRSGDQPRFVNNTVAYNGPYGIRNGTPTVVNSIVWGHTIHDLNVEVERVSYSNVGDNEYDGVNNNLSVDPQFADPANGDFHLVGISPLIDAGNSEAANLPLYDMDGDPRILGTAVDIGADETTPFYQIAVSKSAVPTDTATINEVITYSLRLINNGPASAAGIWLTDALPALTTWSGGLYAPSGTAVVEDNTLQWYGTLLANAAYTIELGARVNLLAPLGSEIVNVATIAVPTGYITASLPVTVTVGPGVYWAESSQTVSDEQLLVGQPFSYTIRLINSGNVMATNVIVTDTLDAQVSFLSADSGGVWDNGQIIWSDLTVMAGEAVTLTAVVATANPITHGYTAVNRVVVAGGGQSYELPDTAVTLYRPAVADFAAAPLTGPAPLAVAFANQSQYADSYIWTYGDGGSSAAAGNHTRSYQTSGVYTVTLTAANPVSSQTITRVAYIAVYDLPVAALSAAPRVGLAPLAVTFTNESLHGESFVWEYGDGITSTTAAEVHTHLYTTPGLYSVRLTAVNANGDHTRLYTNYIAVYDTPVADFTAAPTVGVTPLQVSFSNGSLNATSYHWNFGNGHTATTANPTVLYNISGVYTVTLTASNPGGSHTLVRPAYVTVHSPPNASFTGAPRVGWAPLTVNFTNYSDVADSYLWEYGDGATSATGAYIHSHIYDAPGVYTVRLTASNAYGSNTLIRHNYIAVYDPPEPAFTAAPLAGVEPLTVQFSNESQNATAYLWDFGDGQSSTAVSPTHIYQAGGVYTVTLHASNPGGSVPLTRAEYIHVAHLPQPGFTAAPREGLLNLTSLFTNTSLYADSYIWEYGDGATSDTAALTHTHAYAAPGVYTVTLTAINAHGARTHIEAAYIVVYDMPQADFSANPQTGPVPLNVSFTNQSLHANAYFWDFGDGATSSEENPAHLYTIAGQYTVTLTAANPYASHAVTQTALIAVYDDPVAVFSAAPRIGEGPLVVTFTNHSQYASDFIWDYGDGVSQTVNDPVHAYAYTLPGVYTVTLTAVNPDNAHTLVQAYHIAVMALSHQSHYHVDALHGSNATGDGSRHNPWQTVSHAIAQIQEQDVTVYVATGLYDTALGETFPIGLRPTMRLIGGDRRATILNAPGSGNVVRFSNAIPYPDTTLLQGFKISGGATGVRIEGAATTGQMPVIDGNWITGNTDGVRIYTLNTSRHVNATIGNNLISHNTRYGIYAEANSANQSGHSYITPLIINNIVSHNGSDGIYCYGYGWSGVEYGRCSPQIIGNRIEYNGGSGVRGGSGYAGVTNMELRQNLIGNNAGWGVRRTEGPSEYWTHIQPKFYNNMIYGNGLGGINIHKKDRAVLVNNTIVDNGPFGIKRETVGETNGFVYIVNSIVWGHTDNLNNIIVDWVSYSNLGDVEYAGNNHNLSIDPQFVDRQGQDYHLQPGSPMVDMGDSDRPDLPPIDFEGDPRIWFAAVDIGADELFDGQMASLALTAAPSPVGGGQALTYTLTITSYSHTGLELLLVNSLPLEVEPTGVITRQLTFSAYLDVWVEQITVTVQPDYHGPLVNQAELIWLGEVVAVEQIVTDVIAPVAGLTVTADSLTALGATTTFTASLSAGTAVTYSWEFGDGAVGNGRVVTHTYAAPGLYTAVLTAANSINSDTITTTVLVEEAVDGLAILVDGLDTSPLLLIGQAAEFEAVATAGSDLVYSWTFDDDQPVAGRVVTRAFTLPGVYLVSLTASNQVSGQTKTVVVTVVGPQPGDLHRLYLPLIWRE